MRRQIAQLKLKLWFLGHSERDHYAHTKYCQEFPCRVCRWHRRLASLRHYESLINTLWDWSHASEANQWQPRRFTSQEHRVWRMSAAPKGRLP